MNLDSRKIKPLYIINIKFFKINSRVNRWTGIIFVEKDQTGLIIFNGRCYVTREVRFTFDYTNDVLQRSCLNNNT